MLPGFQYVSFLSITWLSKGQIWVTCEGRPQSININYYAVCAFDLMVTMDLLNSLGLCFPAMLKPRWNLNQQPSNLEGNTLIYWTTLPKLHLAFKN